MNSKSTRFVLNIIAGIALIGLAFIYFYKGQPTPALLALILLQMEMNK